MKVKILIIRFSSIGDIVLTTPVIRCLKNQLEGEVELHFLTKKSFVLLLEHNPYLSKVIGIEKSTNECIDELKKEQYDYIVDLHKNLRSARVKKALPALSFTFEKLNFEKWLFVNFKINRLTNQHVVNRYLKSIEPLGINYDGKGLDYFLPPNFSPRFKLPQNFDGQYIVLVLGAAHNTKKMPHSLLANLVRNISDNIILIGGKEDIEAGAALEQLNPSKILNMAGKTSLHESAFLMKEAFRVISPDTGMMHIAAAFQKKITSVWGNTVPEFGMSPFLDDAHKKSYTVIENNQLSCRPCSKIGYSKCPKKHFKCMRDLAVSEIVATVQ